MNLTTKRKHPDFTVYGTFCLNFYIQAVVPGACNIAMQVSSPNVATTWCLECQMSSYS